MTTHFKILVPVYNSEEWISNTLSSIIKQDYDNFECIITDDCSTDSTVDIIEKFIIDNEVKDYFTLIKNKSRKHSLYNVYEMVNFIRDECDDEDILMTLDGDDWFYDNEVLSKLNGIYQRNDCWLTYGSYIEYPGGRTSDFHVTKYPDNIIESGDFRQDNWRASALRTYKFKLAKQITKEELVDENGDFYTTAGDLAFHFPMLEMARERICFVSDILYVYNLENPLCDHLVDRDEQIEADLTIRQRHPKRDRLVDDRTKWNRFGGDFGVGQRSSTHNKHSKYVVWDEGNDLSNDVSFFIDDYMTWGINSRSKELDEIRYGWMIESQSITPNINDRIAGDVAQYKDYFDTIFTHRKDLIDLDPDLFKFAPAIGCWIKEAKIYDKNKLVSMVSSNKTMCEGHLYRLGWVDKLKDKLDLYGRGFNEVAV